MSSKVPSATHISSAALQHYLSLYPIVINKYYNARVKDPKKLKVALENEKWRYNELPKLVLTRADDSGLIKEELQRLVQWKITHGKFRPTLTALMIRNPTEVVRDKTQSSQRALKPLVQGSEKMSSDALFTTVAKALSGSRGMRGVGPATASLILSVLAPEKVPFFQDETYDWLFPGHVKLKYSDHEYKELLLKATEIIKGMDGIGMVELEKAAFVIGHIDLVDESERVFKDGQQDAIKAKIDELEEADAASKEVSDEFKGLNRRERRAIQNAKRPRKKSETQGRESKRVKA